MKNYTFHIGEGEFISVEAEDIETARQKIIVDGKPLRHNAIEYAIDNNGHQYEWQEDEWLSMKAY